ncbi:hypothetical protein EVAR_51887_1 [Eumeta japonica]|uniref:Uncharacterized protein n=1 Tax=Eumeta variegata TaxID=151549 RepID=A0A4C1XFC7_EUMVA|nr:hypothetical protein EVAR_51887_1 [Eumeta japonica]
MTICQARECQAVHLNLVRSQSLSGPELVRVHLRDGVIRAQRAASGFRDSRVVIHPGSPIARLSVSRRNHRGVGPGGPAQTTHCTHFYYAQPFGPFESGIGITTV